MQEAQRWTWLIKTVKGGKKNPTPICLRSEVTIPGRVCHTNFVKGLNLVFSHHSPRALTLMWWWAVQTVWVEWWGNTCHAFVTVPHTYHEWRGECQVDHYPQGRRERHLPRDSRRLFHPETPYPMCQHCSLKRHYQCRRKSLNRLVGYILNPH